jgi:hypothetical protein
MLNKIRDWWHGDYVPASIEDVIESAHSDSPAEGHFNRPWIAIQCGHLKSFWLRHWQYLLTTLLGLIGLTLLYLQLRATK